MFHDAKGRQLYGAWDEPAWERRRPAGKSRNKIVRNTPARRQRSQRPCLRGKFDIREFPQMRVDNSGGPLADKKFPVSLDDERNKSSSGCLLTLSQIRQFLHAFLPERDAQFFYGTNPAPRIARRADQSAEFHERLIEM
jgi:hypothetical protein